MGDEKLQKVASFETHPDQYKHWTLSFDGPVATLALEIQEENGLRPNDYLLKSNSYDLGVDIELADAIRRLRFEHPEVSVVVVTSRVPKLFCAGANIPMLASSAHGFKVNFCKFTNETRCEIEDASEHSGQRYLAALNGTAAGGGYELALACDEIYLIDDGSSTVSLPEVPLLGVLPGTGGLTRLVDKRKVRRDIADVFCTKAEGFRSRDAVKFRLIDGAFPRSKWDDGIAARAQTLADEQTDAAPAEGIVLPGLEVDAQETARLYRYVTLSLDEESRVAELILHGPDEAAPADATQLRAEGANTWSLRLWRELDDALLHLRFNHPRVGVVVLKSTGSLEAVLAHDAVIHDHPDHWLAAEIRRFQGRVLRRLDNTSRSLFAIIEQDSCFGGSLFEVTLAADRSYMLEDDDEQVMIQVSKASAGLYPTAMGSSRLQIRFAGEPEAVSRALKTQAPLTAPDAEELGLVTLAPDEIDWEDEVRIAIEERASLSPDALTGMEQNLRFVGAENCDSKIFGRLTAWQNWIFQRPNAVGDRGALTMYGHPERPQFDWRRT